MTCRVISFFALPHVTSAFPASRHDLAFRPTLLLTNLSFYLIPKLLKYSAYSDPSANLNDPISRRKW